MITDFNRLPFTNVDCSPCPRSPLCHYFNPLPSARGDPLVPIDINMLLNFNPLPSARGDACDKGYDRILPISIHSPLRGETLMQCIRSSTRYYFNPLPSARGDDRDGLGAGSIKDFNPLPSARGDGGKKWGHSTIQFQSTPLCEGRP